MNSKSFLSKSVFGFFILMAVISGTAWVTDNTTVNAQATDFIVPIGESVTLSWNNTNVQACGLWSTTVHWHRQPPTTGNFLQGSMRFGPINECRVVEMVCVDHAGNRITSKAVISPIEPGQLTPLNCDAVRNRNAPALRDPPGPTGENPGPASVILQVTNQNTGGLPDPVRQNCTLDIVGEVPVDADWNEVFMIRGEDGSAWQRGIISNGGGILELDEFSISNIHGIAQVDTDVQVFMFSPRYDGEGRLIKPDIATCFIADTMWRTTEGQRNVQIQSGYFSLPIAPRILWPNIGSDIVLDAFYKRTESWDALMQDDRYQQPQNFYIGSHLKPSILKVTGGRDDAQLKCNLLCDEGPAIGVELDPNKLPTKLQGKATNFNNVNGRTVMVGRMPGIHTFYAGFKDGAATQADKIALRLLSHQAMGMETFKRAILGNRNASGRPPGLPYISAAQLQDAVNGRNPNVPLDTVMLIRSAARLMIPGNTNTQQSVNTYPEMTTPDQPGLNPSYSEASTQTPSPEMGQSGATPLPLDAVPGVPSAPGFTPNDNTPNSIQEIPSENEFLGYMVPPPVPETPLNYTNQQFFGIPPPIALPPPAIPSSPPANIIPVDFPVVSPVGVPNFPTRPIAPPPGRSIFDGVRRDASLELINRIVNRGQLPNIPALLFPEHSTEESWASDMTQLITFWTGSLKVNPCLLVDDTFLDENFFDQPIGFSATSCQNYIYVSGMTPRLVLRSEESMKLQPDFQGATITETDEPFTENDTWILPEGKKKIRKYLYEFTSKFPETRVNESCIRQSELPELITAFENGLSLNASEVIALSQELHEQVTNPDVFYRLRLADPQDVADRLIWLGNGEKLEIARLFFEIDKSACAQTVISVPNIEVSEDRDGFEAGIIK